MIKYLAVIFGIWAGILLVSIALILGFVWVLASIATLVGLGEDPIAIAIIQLFIPFTLGTIAGGVAIEATKEIVNDMDI